MRNTVLAVATVAVAGVAMPATAQVAASSDTAGTADRVIGEVTACRRIATDAERLACFDRAAQALQTASDTRSIIVMDQAQVRDRRRALFGLVLPRINLFGRDDEPAGAATPEIREVESKVVSVARASVRDRFVVQLEDGSTWQTTELATIPPERGDRVHIKQAALGTYRGSFAGGRAIRITRLR